jgi:hypothetical protein
VIGALITVTAGGEGYHAGHHPMGESRKRQKFGQEATPSN